MSIQNLRFITNDRVLIKRLIYLSIATILTFSAFKGRCQELEKKKDVKQAVNNLEFQSEKAILVDLGEEKISGEEFKNYLLYRPLPSVSKDLKADIDKRLNELIDLEVLYQEALRQNFNQDPELKRKIQQILVRKLLEEEVNKKVSAKQLDDKDIEFYYDQHKYEFNHPEQVCLADIFIATDSNTNKEEKSKIREKVESILSEALTLHNKKFKFNELIKKYSNIHEKYPLGHTGYFDSEGNPLGLHNKFVEEAFKLKEIGQVGENIIETPDGYHIIMLIGKRPPEHKKLDDVRSQIKQRIGNERLKEARKLYIKQLKENIKIHINKKVVTEFTDEIVKLFNDQSILNNKVQSKPTNTPPKIPGHHDEFK